jgi:predicted esterase
MTQRSGRKSGRPLPRALASVAAPLALLLGSVTALASPREELARGEIVDPVACLADSRQTYALFLPSRYDPGRAWPILYLYDARGRGRLAVSPFRESAEKYGWILAGSNSTRSDDPRAGNAAAVQALWHDTRERFSIDPRRLYAGGFSGGARLACSVAITNPGAVAGVIAAGGGFPDSLPPRREARFPFFGTAGEEDFNYHELKSLDATLEKLGFPHRLEVFAGGHAWPPEALCAEAIEWFEVLAMSGGAPRDEKALEAILAKRLSRAREKQAAGRLLDAWRDYSALARDFRSLKDVAGIEARLAELETNGARKLAAREQKRDAADSRELARLQEVLRAVQPGGEPPALAHMLGELRVRELRKKAAGKDREEAVAARRLLASVFVQASFYLPRDLLEKRDFTRAIFFLTVATEIRPESPWVWYDRACAYSRSGDQRRALQDLRAAVEKGFRDRDHMAGDPDLAPLREEPAFQELLRAMPEVTPTPGG